MATRAIAGPNGTTLHVPMSPLEEAAFEASRAPTQAEIIADFDRRLMEHFDAKARERRYDNRITCALRAGYAGPFHAEGAAFASWMDACNAHCYDVLAQVLAGQRAIPTWEQLKAELPVLTWP